MAERLVKRWMMDRLAGKQSGSTNRPESCNEFPLMSASQLSAPPLNDALLPSWICSLIEMTLKSPVVESDGASTPRRGTVRGLFASVNPIFIMFAPWCSMVQRLFFSKYNFTNTKASLVLVTSPLLS